MDKLVKPDVNELQFTFNKAQNGSATFRLANLMHTMSAAVCLTTSNPSLFSISQPFSVIPPLSSFSYTVSLSQQSDRPPLSNPPNTITVRSSMLPIGKAHPDDLPSLFSKYRPHIFQDATIPISFVGPYVVEFLMLRETHVPEFSFHMKKAVSECTKSQLTGFLLTAVSYGKSDTVSALIDAGADVNVKNSSGLSLLSVGVGGGNVDVVKSLIASDCPIDNSVDLVFHSAAAMNSVDLFRVLSSNLRKMDASVVDSEGRSPIHIAASNGHVEIIRFCVSIGGNPETRDCNGWTPLHCAAAEGHLDVVECFLECSNMKYVTTNDGKTAFALAVDNGHPHLFHLLHLGDVLQRAARVDDVHGLKSCLAAGARVNDRDQHGWTPLHRAAFKGRLECARLLLEYGAQVDAVNDAGRTPLQCAVETGHLQVALMLVANGKKLKGLPPFLNSDYHPLLVAPNGTNLE